MLYNMYHLRLTAVLSVLLILVHCVATAPSPIHRYFKPSSSSEQEGALSGSENWLIPELLNLMSVQRTSWPKASNRHHRERRGCNTATCVTQRLADYMVRSNNIMGTVYVPTNVGSGTYGRRELPQDFLTL